MHLRILLKDFKIFDFICINNNILQSLCDYSLPSSLLFVIIVSMYMTLLLTGILVRIMVFKKVEHRRDTNLKVCVFWLIVIIS